MILPLNSQYPSVKRFYAQEFKLIISYQDVTNNSNVGAVSLTMLCVVFRTFAKADNMFSALKRCTEQVSKIANIILIKINFF